MHQASHVVGMVHHSEFSLDDPSNTRTGPQLSGESEGRRTKIKERGEKTQQFLRKTCGLPPPRLGAQRFVSTLAVEFEPLAYGGFRNPKSFGNRCLRPALAT